MPLLTSLLISLYFSAPLLLGTFMATFSFLCHTRQVVRWWSRVSFPFAFKFYGTSFKCIFQTVLRDSLFFLLVHISFSDLDIISTPQQYCPLEKLKLSCGSYFLFIYCIHLFWIQVIWGFTLLVILEVVQCNRMGLQ